MVSTRQMTITTGPGAVEDPFSDSTTATLARNVSAASRSANGDDIPNKQTIFLLDLPIEILDKIFSHVGYKQCAQMRVVSQEYNFFLCVSDLCLYGMYGTESNTKF